MQRAFISPPPLFNLAPFQRNLWEYVRTLLILFVVVVIIIEPITLFNLLLPPFVFLPLSLTFSGIMDPTHSLTHLSINQYHSFIYALIHHPRFILYVCLYPLYPPFAFRFHDALYTPLEYLIGLLVQIQILLAFVH